MGGATLVAAATWTAGVLVADIGPCGTETGAPKRPASKCGGDCCMLYNLVEKSVSQITRHGARRPTLPAGNYVFVDTNHGGSAHELVMWKTADPDDRLPMDKDDRVNEDSPALNSVLDSGSSLRPGETRLLATTLDPGHYVLVCNLPGHFKAGMHVDLTVQ